MNGFTDIHTHLLPGADDGAKDLQDALALIKMAWENGTRTIILTPHFRGVYKKNTPEMLQQMFEAFQQTVAAEYPEMKLHLGCEIHYQSEVPEWLREEKILSMCGSEYALLEFSSKPLRSRVVSAVLNTLQLGYTPIIAHAERYEIFRKDESLLNEVLDLGALIQLNADSVLGKHGFGVKQFCRKLLKTERAHFIASDAHDTTHRPPLLRECYLRVNKKYGEEYAARVFYENAQAVIENRMI